MVRPDRSTKNCESGMSATVDLMTASAIDRLRSVRTMTSTASLTLSDFDSNPLTERSSPCNQEISVRERVGGRTEGSLRWDCRDQDRPDHIPCQSHADTC